MDLRYTIEKNCSRLTWCARWGVDGEDVDGEDGVEDYSQNFAIRMDA